MASIRLSDLEADIKHRLGTAESTRLIMPLRDKQAEYAQALSQVLRQRYEVSAPAATDERTPKPSEEEH
jgi:hypothetical protein